MDDERYLKYCRGLLTAFAADLGRRLAELPAEDPLAELAAAFQRLATGEVDLYREGPSLVTRLFTTCPQLAPLFPRDLLWFFGGECLHFMPDEEIARFQALEEARQEAASRGELFNLRDARAKLLNLQ